MNLAGQAISVEGSGQDPPSELKAWTGDSQYKVGQELAHNRKETGPSAQLAHTDHNATSKVVPLARVWPISLNLSSPYKFPSDLCVVIVPASASMSGSSFHISTTSVKEMWALALNLCPLLVDSSTLGKRLDSCYLFPSLFYPPLTDHLSISSTPRNKVLTISLNLPLWLRPLSSSISP